MLARLAMFNTKVEVPHKADKEYANDEIDENTEKTCKSKHYNNNHKLHNTKYTKESQLNSVSTTQSTVIYNDP